MATLRSVSDDVLPRSVKSPVPTTRSVTSVADVCMYLAAFVLGHGRQLVISAVSGTTVSLAPPSRMAASLSAHCRTV